MSDRDGPVGNADDDLSLPKATVQKLVAELLPSDVVCSKDTLHLIIECCVEFIHLVSSEANEICEKESKKTIAPEHIISALKVLGFEGYTTEVEEVLKDHKKAVKDRESKSSKKNDSGLSQEELAAQQEALFAQSKARFEAGVR